eukprot:403370462
MPSLKLFIDLLFQKSLFYLESNDFKAVCRSLEEKSELYAYLKVIDKECQLVSKFQKSLNYIDKTYFEMIIKKHLSKYLGNEDQAKIAMLQYLDSNYPNWHFSVAQNQEDISLEKLKKISYCDQFSMMSKKISRIQIVHNRQVISIEYGKINFQIGFQDSMQAFEWKKSLKYEYNRVKQEKIWIVKYGCFLNRIRQIQLLDAEFNENNCSGQIHVIQNYTEMFDNWQYQQIDPNLPNYKQQKSLQSTDSKRRNNIDFDNSYGDSSQKNMLSADLSLMSPTFDAFSQFQNQRSTTDDKDKFRLTNTLDLENMRYTQSPQNTHKNFEEELKHDAEQNNKSNKNNQYNNRQSDSMLYQMKNQNTMTGLYKTAFENTQDLKKSSIHRKNQYLSSVDNQNYSFYEVPELQREMLQKFLKNVDLASLFTTKKLYDKNDLVIHESGLIDIPILDKQNMKYMTIPVIVSKIKIQSSYYVIKKSLRMLEMHKLWNIGIVKTEIQSYFEGQNLYLYSQSIKQKSKITDQEEQQNFKNLVSYHFEQDGQFYMIESTLNFKNLDKSVNSSILYFKIYCLIKHPNDCEVIQIQSSLNPSLDLTFLGYLKNDQISQRLMRLSKTELKGLQNFCQMAQINIEEQKLHIQGTKTNSTQDKQQDNQLISKKLHSNLKQQSSLVGNNNITDSQLLVNYHNQMFEKEDGSILYDNNNYDNSILKPVGNIQIIMRSDSIFDHQQNYRNKGENSQLQMNATIMTNGFKTANNTIIE